MEDIHLLVQLDQVLIEAGTLRRHLIVGFVQLLLQFIASVAIEHLYIGTFLIRKVVIIGQLTIRQGDKRYPDPHIRHGQEAQQELIRAQGTEPVRFMQLPQHLGRECIDRQHTSAYRLDWQRAKLSGMFRTYRIFLYGLLHLGSGRALRPQASYGKESRNQQGRFTSTRS